MSLLYVNYYVTLLMGVLSLATPCPAQLGGGCMVVYDLVKVSPQLRHLSNTSSSVLIQHIC